MSNPANSRVATVAPDLSGLIRQSLQNNIPRSSETEKFLNAKAPQGLGTRLAEIASHPALNPAQRTETLRLAVLSRGFFHPQFTSTEEHYHELRPLASAIARSISQGLEKIRPAVAASSTVSEDRSHRLSEGGSGKTLAAAESWLGGSIPASGGYPAPRNLDRSLSFYGNSQEHLPPLPGTQVNSSTLAAGMMGVRLLSFSNGAPLSFHGDFGDSRPSYFIESLSATESETHSGNGENSSQQNPRQQGQEQNAQAEA
jgi:hypothetical protein